MSKLPLTACLALSVVATAAFLLPACSNGVTEGAASTPAPDPVTVSTETAPVVKAENRVPTSVPQQKDKPLISPEYVEVSEAAGRATRDFGEFWKENFGVKLGADVVPFERIEDAPCMPNDGIIGDHSGWICPDTLPKRSVAIYLPNAKKNYWDKGGMSAMYYLLGHELSHFGIVDLNPAADTNDDLEELRATCGAGSFVYTAAKMVEGVDLEKSKAGLRYVEMVESFDAGSGTKYTGCTTYVHPSLR